MNNKKIIITLFSFVLLATLFVQCKKDNVTDIGTDLIGDNDRLKVSVIDTISIAAYTQVVDTLRTDGVSYATIGTYIDPIFGETSASLVSQLLMSTSKAQNDSLTVNGVVPDSLVIQLIYPNDGTQTYGNKAVDAKINVSRINKFLNPKNAYYSNHKIDDLNPTFDTDITFNPKEIIDEAEIVAKKKWQALIDTALANKQDTSKISKVEPEAILSIKLSDKICKEVYTALKQSIKENATFVEQFNGLCFMPDADANNKSISVFNYENTKIILYYHSPSNTKKVKEYQLSFSKYAAHFNVFNHNYSKGNILADLNKSSNKLDTVVYLQGMGGLHARLKFPYIKNLISKGRWAVSKAELILNVPSDNVIEESKYPAPTQLMLYRIDEQNQLYILTEFYVKNNYNGEEYTDNQYIFDLTLYMQKILKGEYKNNDLLISVKNEAVNPARTVVGANNSTKAIKLRLIASKL